MSTIQKALAKRELTASSVSTDHTSTVLQINTETIQQQNTISDQIEISTENQKNVKQEWNVQQDQANTISQSRFHRLPFDQLRQIGILTPDARRSQLAEEYRLIKRPLLLNVDKKGADIADNPNLIMVTSALSGEGKTFTSINLAMSIAMEQDRTVLLVDGDVAKPAASKRLGINFKQGLIDLLENDQLSIADVLVKTNIENMRVIPAGKHHDRSTELLASERMLAIMEELSTRYPDRIVIFDSPPLLLTTESAVLSEMMGQIVLVVAAEQTVQQAVTEALARLGQDKIKGLVLNKYRPSFGNRYGTGYGYSYSYGYGDAPTTDVSHKPKN
ncbi:protein tyrosine kinase [Chromatium okenii]|uniref:XrtA-associated tyrosine autokinase n=1 Tax=Chromatium okenii TaxID=61644 RepID=UPI001903DCC2|nr:XrtA-associated tyrosine autokinase [Chromatium okenii]MBK1640333.1 protein tyrosine kinase [Chromatium okenii]